MKFSSKISKELASLMSQIQDEFLLEPADTNWFSFNTFPEEEESGGDYATGLYISLQQQKLLQKVTELGAIECKKIENDNPKIESHSFQIKINRSKFDNLYRELIGNSVDVSAGAHPFVFYLDNKGDFWREPKEKFCYSLSAKSDRLKILKYLVDNPDFHTAEEIAEHLGDKDPQVIRVTIGKLKRSIENRLKVEDPVIESMKDSGYRLNPKCKVAKM